jgi:hypothetical protein
MKKLYRAIVALHILIGIGALAGGLGAVMNPGAPMGMSVEALKKGPFTSFLVPGLFLMIVLGLGNIGAAIAAARKAPLHGIYSGAMGAIMLAWIVIQCVILEAVVALHIIFFCLGAVQGILACVLLYRRNEWPMSVIRYWFGNDPE